MTLWKSLRPILFRFDAETIHAWTHHLLKILGSRQLGKKILETVSSSAAEVAMPSPHSVFGTIFRSPVGLAAGFDKNAELLGALPHLGFGFAEIGTVTPKPQPGNLLPRLFRDSDNQSLFNRMGFNSLGAIKVSQNLREARLRGDLPIHFRVGVNLGKNKETSAEDAGRDYAEAASFFNELSDYMVINVSSPNTPGLRDLQTLDSLKKIIDSVQAVISKWKRTPPLLLKLSPELEGESFRQILNQGADLGISGWVLTNTLGGERKNSPSELPLPGGWSGSVLSSLSLKRLQEARSETSLPIISSGGIMNEKDASVRLLSGASLIQVYTGWIYGGPQFPAKIAAFLAKKPTLS